MNKKVTKIAAILIMFTILLVSVSSATACTLADSQWPKDGHDNQNTGQSQYLGPQNNSTQWTKNLSEDIDTNPIVGPNGTVYLGTYNDTSENGNLYAFNPDSTVKWNYTVTDGEWNEISSTPAISSEGTIFFGTNFEDTSGNDHGNFYALSQTGEYLWNYTISGLESQIYSSPAIGSDGTVYFLAYITNVGNTVANLFALTKDGALKWNYTLGTSDGGTHSPVIGQDGTIYIAVDSYFSGILYAITDATDHAVEKWNYTLSDEPYVRSWIVDTPAIGSDGTLYFGTGFSSMMHEAPMGVFYALTDAGNHAAEKWEYPLYADMSEITTSPAIAKDGTIYFGYYAALFMGPYPMQFMGLEALTDNVTQAIEKWYFDTEYSIDYAPAIGSDGTVYFGDDSSPKTFYALESNGTEKWRLNASSITAAAISKVGTLYFGSYDRPDGTYGPVLYAIQGPPSSLYVKTTVDNANPGVGDTVTITYYVGNNGPNTAYNTVLKFPIPAGMQFVKAWTTYGIGSITYDAATNTVIWDLGDLPIIDPEAWVQLIAQAAGQITITPLLSTLTNDPNISSNIQSININVHAASTSTTTPATGNTIGMQTTGIPIAMLITAILMVLGGSLVPRRKK